MTSAYISPFINVEPAYGKDYKTQKEVKAAWEAGKDFIILDFTNPYYGKPINKEDAENAGTIQAVNIRFAGQQKLCVIKSWKKG